MKKISYLYFSPGELNPQLFLPQCQWAAGLTTLISTTTNTPIHLYINHIISFTCAFTFQANKVNNCVRSVSVLSAFLPESSVKLRVQVHRRRITAVGGQTSRVQLVTSPPSQHPISCPNHAGTHFGPDWWRLAVSSAVSLDSKISKSLHSGSRTSWKMSDVQDNQQAAVWQSSSVCTLCKLHVVQTSRGDTGTK